MSFLSAFWDSYHDGFVIRFKRKTKFHRISNLKTLCSQAHSRWGTGPPVYPSRALMLRACFFHEHEWRRNPGCVCYGVAGPSPDACLTTITCHQASSPPLVNTTLCDNIKRNFDTSTISSPSLPPPPPHFPYLLLIHINYGTDIKSYFMMNYLKLCSVAVTYIIHAE